MSDLPKGVYIRDIHKKKKKKKVMSGSTDVLLFFNIRTSHLTKHRSLYFQEFTNMSKINQTKKVIEYLNVLRKYYRVRQEVSYENPREKCIA